MKPREGETLEPYLERLTDALVLSFVKQEFDAGRVTPPGIAPLLVRLDQERSEAANGATSGLAGSQHDELRVSLLCEKFWNAHAGARESENIAEPRCVVRSRDRGGSHFWNRWPTPRKKRNPTRRGARVAPCCWPMRAAWNRKRARRAATVAAGLAEIAPQIERLWPHPSATDFGRGIVHALLLETSPGIAGSAFRGGREIWRAFRW